MKPEVPDHGADPLARSKSLVAISQRDDPEAQKLARIANACLHRLTLGWDDWMMVAEGYARIRLLAMRDARTNRPLGRGYQQAFIYWVERTKFQVGRIDRSTQSALVTLHESLDMVETWRATLSEQERLRYSHPRVVLQKWRASLRVKDPKPVGVVTHKMRAEALQRKLGEVYDENARMHAAGLPAFDLAKDGPTAAAEALCKMADEGAVNETTLWQLMVVLKRKLIQRRRAMTRARDAKKEAGSKRSTKGA